MSQKTEPKINELLAEVIAATVDKFFDTDEMVEGVDNIIEALQMKFSLLDKESIDKEEVGYMLLLMATNQAFNDGIADKLSDHVAAAIRIMFEDGEMPEETMARMREHMAQDEAEKQNEQSNDPLPQTDVEELDLRNGEPEPSGVESADA